VEMSTKPLGYTIPLLDVSCCLGYVYGSLSLLPEGRSYHGQANLPSPQQASRKNARLSYANVDAMGEGDFESPS